MYAGNFFQFYPVYFSIPEGFGKKFLLNEYHLWYLQDLFIFSLIFLPFFMPWRKLQKSLFTRLAILLCKPWTLLLLFIPLTLAEILIDEMNIGLDNEEVCQILLNGIISDNGYFKHIRRDKSFSLLISYFLTQKGADPKESYNRIFGQKSIFSKRLLSLALSRLQTIGSGKILWTYITDDDKKSNNNSTADSAAVFNEIMSVNNVEIGIYFKISKDKVNISFRSSDSIDVAELAKSFGGGGHRAASGTTVAGKFEDIKDNVLNRALELVKRVK